MATSINARTDGQYVEVVHSGVLSRAELEDARARTARALEEHGFVRLLIDGRAADISALSNIDAFEFSAGHAEALPSTAALRMALLVSEDHGEVARFAETVARNRRLNVHVFFDAAGARAWLAGSER